MGVNGSEEYFPIYNGLFLAQITAVTLDTSLHVKTFTGTTTNNSTTISGITDTSQLQVGMVVTGTGIRNGPPFDITIVSIPSSSSIKLSNPCTASGTVTITAAMYLYDWAEQTYDPIAGAAYPLTGGRDGVASSMPQQQPAYEVNNLKIDSSQLPMYVWIRYRTAPGGDTVFEFEKPDVDVLPFWARIDSNSSTKYGWTELVPATGGSWSVKTNGRSGTTTTNPAYELNLNTGVTADGSFHVIMWYGYLNTGIQAGQEFVFVSPPGASGGSSTLSVITGVCADYITGPLPTNDGGTGADNSSGGGPMTVMVQDTSGGTIVGQPLTSMATSSDLFGFDP